MQMTMKQFCREYLAPAMSDAYKDGVAGAAGYPMDPAAELAALDRLRGPASHWGERFISELVRCLNLSYAQGRRDAAAGRGEGMAIG